MASAGRLSSDAVETLVAAAVRFPAIQSVCLAEIKPEHFDPIAEPDLRLFWRAVLQLAERNGGSLPVGSSVRASLDIEVKNTLETSADPAITADRLLGTTGFIPWVFSWDEADFDENTLRSYLEQFIAERNNDLIAGLVNLTRQRGLDATRQEQIRQLMDNTATVRLSEKEIFQSPFPTAEDAALLRTTYARLSTGVRWLDKYMNGGHVAQQVYTLCGPSGVGKTSAGVMLCVAGAREQLKLFAEKRIETPGIWYMITSEQSFRDIRWRMLAHAAMIDEERLKRAYQEEFKTLRRVGEPMRAYEQYLLSKIDESLPADRWGGEYERLQRALTECENGIRVIDTTGSFPGLYGANIPTIGRYIKNRIDRGVPCAGVVLDWAGNLVSNMLVAKGKDPSKDNMVAELNAFVPQVISKIAIPCNCPVWVLHQLAGAQNKVLPTQRQQHSNAQWSTTFSFNAWYAFCFGTKDKVNNVCHVWADKTRNSASDASGAILKIEGNVSWLRDADGEFEPDGSTGRFVTKSMSRNYVAPSQAAGVMADLPNADEYTQPS